MKSKAPAARSTGIAALGGVLAALALPPWDLWFLGPIGFAALFWVVGDASRRQQLLSTGGFFVAYFVVGLSWVSEFSAPGVVLVVLLEALLMTLPILLLRRSRTAAYLALPGALVLGEAVRYRWPLGGLPMGGPALGQANGPLLPIARLGGDLALVLTVAVIGVALAAAAKREWRVVAAATLVATVGVAAGQLSDAPPATKSVRVAYVQGGGPRGLSAAENTETDVFGNQLAAMELLGAEPVDVILWPEDVVDLPGPIANDPVKDDIGALAKQYGATIVAGVVEDSGETRFRNAAIAFDRSGKIVDRYDKVHRVPFGEFIPARKFISKIADVSPVPRDAIAGTGDGVLLTRHGELGVVISFEVFFADRARIATRAGGELLLVPTNASSFTGRQAPAQEVAAAQLRAVESGRDLVQAAPTGYSAFVDADGKVTKASKLGPAAAAVETLQRRTGMTPFNRWGDVPVLIFTLLLLVAGAVLDRTVKTNK